MMKRLLNLIWLVLTLCPPLFSQPVFNQSNFATPDEFIQAFSISSPPIHPGSPGINQTWDFSMYTNYSTLRLYKCVDPSLTPFQSDFPTADIALYEQNSLFPNITFFQSQPGELNVIGKTRHEGINLLPVVYNNPKRIAEFPFTFGTSFSDSFSYSYSFLTDTITGSQFKSALVSYEADGYGLLITPEQTYANSLRVHRIEIQTDSTIYNNHPTASGDFKITVSHKFEWYSDNLLFPNFIISVDSIFRMGDTTIYGGAGFTGIVTSVNETDYVKSIIVYPVPAGNSISIKSESLNKLDEVLIHVHDVSGKVIDFRILRKGIDEGFLFETEKFPPGVYQIVLKHDNSVFRGSFVKL